MGIRFQDLPIEERLRLIEDLWDSIVSGAATIELTGAQRAELDRRLDAYELDKSPGRSANEAVESIRRRLF